MPTYLPSVFALQTWTLRRNFSNHRDIGARERNIDLLRKVRSFGYTSVEVSARGNTPLAAFLAIIREADLTCCGIHLPCLCRLDGDSAKRTVADVTKKLAEAFPRRRVDWSKCILSFMGNPMYLRGNVERYREFAELLKHAIGPRTGRKPRTAFAYHLYDFDLDASPECIQAILDSGCKLVLDTFYLNRSLQTWDDVLHNYANDIIGVHINDTSPGKEQTALGTGTERWLRNFSYMGQFANCSKLIVEHDAPQDRGMRMARESAEFLLSDGSLLGTYWKNRRVS
jgi:sugar phosphate isomerase/epimerase